MVVCAAESDSDALISILPASRLPSGYSLALRNIEITSEINSVSDNNGPVKVIVSRWNINSTTSHIENLVDGLLECIRYIAGPGPPTIKKIWHSNTILS